MRVCVLVATAIAVALVVATTPVTASTSPQRGAHVADDDTTYTTRTLDVSSVALMTEFAPKQLAAVAAVTDSASIGPLSWNLLPSTTDALINPQIEVCFVWVDRVDRRYGATEYLAGDLVRIEFAPTGADVFVRLRSTMESPAHLYTSVYDDEKPMCLYMHTKAPEPDYHAATQLFVRARGSSRRARDQERERRQQRVESKQH